MYNQTIFGENVEEMSASELFKRKSDQACRDEIIRRYLPKMKEKAYAESETFEEYEELYSCLCELLLKCVDEWEEDIEHVRKYRYFSVFLGTKMNNCVHVACRNMKKKTGDQVLNEPLVATMNCCEDCEKYIDERLNDEDRKEAIRWLLQGLTKREYDTIVIRYYGGCSLEETARTLGISRERARQIEAKALAKLRGYCSRAGILAYDLLR